MNYDLVRWYNETVYFQMNMLQAEIEMQGMIAENKFCADNGQSVAYGEEAFNALVEKYGIHHNKFPCYKEGY